MTATYSRGANGRALLRHISSHPGAETEYIGDSARIEFENDRAYTSNAMKGKHGDSQAHDLETGYCEAFSPEPRHDEQDHAQTHHELFLPPRESVYPMSCPIKFSHDDGKFSNDGCIPDGDRRGPRRREGGGLFSFVQKRTSAMKKAKFNKKLGRVGRSVGANLSVTFKDRVTVFPVYPIEVYPPDVRLAMWASTREISMNKRRRREEIANGIDDWNEACEGVCAALAVKPTTAGLFTTLFSNKLFIAYRNAYLSAMCALIFLFSLLQ